MTGRIDSEPWTCAACAGDMIGHRTLTGVCALCARLALAGQDPAAAGVLATRLAAGPAPAITTTITERTP